MIFTCTTQYASTRPYLVMVSKWKMFLLKNFKKYVHELVQTFANLGERLRTWANLHEPHSWRTLWMRMIVTLNLFRSKYTNGSRYRSFTWMCINVGKGIFVPIVVRMRIDSEIQFSRVFTMMGTKMPITELRRIRLMVVPGLSASNGVY